MACYPERVSLDDYMGFMPDLTHSEKVHVQFCPKVIVYYSFFHHYRAIPYYKPSGFLVSSPNNILYSVKFILMSRLLNDDFDDDDDDDNDDDISKQRKI